MINASLRTAGGHSTPASSAPASPPQASQKGAGSAPGVAHPALHGLPPTAHGERAPRQELAGTPSPEHARRTQAFNAQRQALAAQAGSSHDRHLIALDQLQARNFEPAPGGMKIPLAPHALPGGGKRVQTVGTSSRNVHVVPMGVINELREAIADKQLMIQTLAEVLAQAEEEGNPVEIARHQQLLTQAREDLRNYMRQAAVYGEEHRRMNR